MKLSETVLSRFAQVFPLLSPLYTQTDSALTVLIARVCLNYKSRPLSYIRYVEDSVENKYPFE